MNYYISDMHFFHKNVTKEGNNFDNRPFNSLAEMHQYMKEKWNSKITNGDAVYILGDLSSFQEYIQSYQDKPQMALS